MNRLKKRIVRSLGSRRESKFKQRSHCCNLLVLFHTLFCALANLEVGTLLNNNKHACISSTVKCCLFHSTGIEIPSKEYF